MMTKRVPGIGWCRAKRAEELKRGDVVLRVNRGAAVVMSAIVGDKVVFVRLYGLDYKWTLNVWKRRGSPVPVVTVDMC